MEEKDQVHSIQNQRQSQEQEANLLISFLKLIGYLILWVFGLFVLAIVVLFIYCAGSYGWFK